MIRRAILERFPVLEYAEYRKLLAVNAVTTFGFWFTYIALFTRFVFETEVGVVSVAALSFVGLVPALLFGPVAGSVADRFDRRRLLIGAELASTAVLVALLLDDSKLVAYAAFFGLNAFTELYKPAQRAVLTRMVPEEEYVSANGLLSTTATVARIVGPGVAGALVAVVEPEVLFAADAVTYLASVVVLATLPSYTVESDSTSSLAADLGEGLAFVRNRRTLGLLIAIGVGAYGTVGAFNALIPVYVRDVLGLDATAYGVLMTGTAGGAFVAGVLLGWLGDAVDELPSLGASLIVVGGGIVAMVAFPTFGVVVAMGAIAGFGFSAVGSLALAVVQKRSGSTYTGRVVGLFRGANKGSQLAAMALGGVVAAATGVPAVFVGVGVGLAALGAAVLAAVMLPLRNRQTSKPRGG